MNIEIEINVTLEITIEKATKLAIVLFNPQS